MRYSSRFAELIGIYMGDGNLGKYPRCKYLRIYFNPKQRQYIDDVKAMLLKQFGKNPYERYRKDAGVTYLEVTLKDMDKYMGFPVGSKIRNKITIPDWIWKKEIYLKSCLRGLFDTDGCIYITGGKYKIVNYTSHNYYLLLDIYAALEKLKFHPYGGQARIELGRIQEVKRFFKFIKPRNKNHYRFDK